VSVGSIFGFLLMPCGDPTHVFRTCLFVGMKSNINKILVSFVGAEGRGRTGGRLTLQRLPINLRPQRLIANDIPPACSVTS
jgi:hypothetical protein